MAGCFHVFMAEICVNTLWFEGDKEDIDRFVHDIELHGEQLGNYFVRLHANAEKEGVGSEGLISATPWENTVYFSTPVVENQQHEITWDSRRYPSILAIVRLSVFYPSILFILRYDGTGGPIHGEYVCKNGNLLTKK